jgi:hypothetical protein
MKPLSFVLYLLVINATGVKCAAVGLYAVSTLNIDAKYCKEKRQMEAGRLFIQSVNYAGKQPVLNAASSTELKPELYTNAVRNRTIWGPFTLNPSNVHFRYPRNVLRFNL